MLRCNYYQLAYLKWLSKWCDDSPSIKFSLNLFSIFPLDFLWMCFVCVNCMVNRWNDDAFGFKTNINFIPTERLQNTFHYWCIPPPPLSLSLAISPFLFVAFACSLVHFTRLLLVRLHWKLSHIVLSLLVCCAAKKCCREERFRFVASNNFCFVCVNVHNSTGNWCNFCYFLMLSAPKWYLKYLQFIAL